MMIAENDKRIQQLRREINQLKQQISEYRKMQERAETIIDAAESNLKKLNGVIENFHKRMNNAAKQFDGNFGKYYHQELSGILKQNGLYDVESVSRNDNRELKNTIVDIDNKIESCNKKIMLKETEILFIKATYDELKVQMEEND